MKLTVQETSDSLICLGLEGSLNLGGVHAIEASFLAKTTGARHSVVVDFSQVDFIASMGMRLLIKSAKSLQHDDKKIVILNPQPAVEKVLENAGMTNVLAIAHDGEEARALAMR